MWDIKWLTFPSLLCICWTTVLWQEGMIAKNTILILNVAVLRKGSFKAVSAPEQAKVRTADHGTGELFPPLSANDGNQPGSAKRRSARQVVLLNAVQQGKTAVCLREEASVTNALLGWAIKEKERQKRLKTSQPTLEIQEKWVQGLVELPLEIIAFPLISLEENVSPAYYSC